MNHVIISIILVPTLSLCCLGMIQPLLQYDEEGNSLNRCIYTVIERFIPNNLIIMNHSSSAYLDSSVLSQLHKENRWIIATNEIYRNSFNFHTESQEVGFVILVKSAHQLDLVLKNITVVNRNHRLLFILQQPVENQIISKILRPLFKNTAINMKIIARNPVNITQNTVYSRIYRCGRPRQDIIQYCFSGIFSNESLSVNTKKRIRRCSLTAVGIVLPPYTNTRKNGREIRGIEETLLNTVVQRLQTSLIYRNIAYERKGDIYPNGTATENFLLLQNGSADIIFGDLAMTETRWRYFRSVTHYTTEDISWCAPFKPIVGYDHFFNNISIQFLVYITTIYFVTFFAMWCINSLEQREPPLSFSLLNIFSVLLGVPIRNFPSTGRMRFLMGMFACAALVLNIIYSSYITSVLISANYDAKYDNFEDIHKDNLTIYGTSSTKHVLQHANIISPSDVTAQEVAMKLIICNNNTRCLERVVKNNSAVFVSNLHRNYLFKYEEIPHVPLIHCSEQYFYKSFLTMYVRKDFPLLREMNRIIGSITSSGLMTKWKRDIGDELAPHTYPSPMIRLEHLTPVFKMYLGACAIAIIVFIVEVVIGLNI